MSEAVDYLLVGGGLAAATAAERLRALDGEGSILLVGREIDPPYHRPPCSKGILQGKETAEQTYIHPREWYDQQRIELLTRTSVTSLDPKRRVARLSNGSELSYRSALLATGANVRRLSLEGGDLEGIHYLRTLPNAGQIKEEAEAAQEVVLVGGSYIACEVAASLNALGKRCSLVMLERHPFERSFGARVGERLGGLLAEHGIRLYPEQEVVALEGEGRVSAVRTSAGKRIAGELVVIGAGVVPEMRLARAAGIEPGELGGVPVDSKLRTAHPDLYAAGDICEFPSPFHNRRLRLEHWDVAYNQGAVAAENMAGGESDYAVLPYFFSDLADFAALEYVGPALSWEEELERVLAPNRFTTYYLADGRVVGALAVGEPEAIALARLLIERQTVLEERLRRELADPDTPPQAVRERLEEG